MIDTAPTATAGSTGVSNTGEARSTGSPGTGTQPSARNTSGPAGVRRVGFLGTGYIADWHAQAIKKVSGTQLVAVCDRVVSKAEALAAKYGVAKSYGSLEAMLAAEKLDAVHVLLPPNLHFEAARTILAAGVDVFMEKPMCDSADDCRELVRLAREGGRRLGVGHNFLFSEHYEKLRNDMHSGVLGKIDNVTITWHRPLPPTQFGPFDIWMLRDPRNILLEIGSHSVAHMLDMVGEPDEMRVHPSNAMVLPTGRTFYRRWQVNAYQGATAVELRFSFVPGFAEYTIHVRGSLASATVDFERSTYTRQQHSPKDPDFDAHAMVVGQAKSLKKQAGRTLLQYFRSKIDLGTRGTPYGATLARAMDAFYVPAGRQIDDRIAPERGAKVIEICEKMGALANLPAEALTAAPLPLRAGDAPAPSVLVLGGTGFIGKELVRQLVASGRHVRMLVRSTGNLPRALRVPEVDCQVGDLMNEKDLEQAMTGVQSVIHLARSNVKSWADYQRYEVGGTKLVAEVAKKMGVERLVYTGTIASYYQGAHAGTITEMTPLDPKIARGNLYARAKTASEDLLLAMHKEQGLPVVILRPGVVIGRGGSPFHWGVGMWWHDAICQTWGAGKNKLPLVLVEDVVSGLISAMTKPGVEGKSYNLVGDPLLTADDYLDELDRSGRFQIQRFPTPIFKFYMIDMFKWVAKAALRFPDLQMPHYRDWESRTLIAPFDCSAAKQELDWRPETDRAAFIQRGIGEPVAEFTQ